MNRPLKTLLCLLFAGAMFSIGMANTWADEGDLTSTEGSSTPASEPEPTEPVPSQSEVEVPAQPEDIEAIPTEESTDSAQPDGASSAEPEITEPSAGGDAAPTTEAGLAIEVKYQSLGGEDGSLGLVRGDLVYDFEGAYQSYDRGLISWAPDTGAHALFGNTAEKWISQELDEVGFPVSDEEESGAIGVSRVALENGLIVNSSQHGAKLVSGAILERYRAMGEEDGVLGIPITDEQDGSVEGSRISQFAKGIILWSEGTGAREVHGSIKSKYVSLGRESGDLGLPVSDEMTFHGGRISKFQGEVIAWTSATRARVLYGDVAEKWLELGAKYSGFPRYDEYDSQKSGVTRALLQKGLIVNSLDYGAKLVRGSILSRYRKMGEENGVLGVPTSDEQDGYAAGTRISHFKKGMIVWSQSTGAWELHGSIAKKYRWLGREGGKLGLPVSNEENYHGGRISRFQRGVIVWTSKHGAYAIRNGMFTVYNTRGAWSSGVGFPTSDERTVGSKHYQQDFENARLELIRGENVMRVKSNPYVKRTSSADVRYTYRSGCPVGPSQLRTVAMNYYGYDGKVHRGWIIVRDWSVNRVITAFDYAAWRSFPIYQMRNPNTWRGNDPSMMYANNTSGFNCRKVVGNPYSTSPHSYGTAIDINTVQNPYYDGKKWWPSNGTRWISQRSGKGVLSGSDPMTRGMVNNGYFWGGKWRNKDYQHFQIN